MVKKTAMDPADFKKGWVGGLPETPCGYGSTLAQTVLQRKVIEDMIQNLDVKSIVDVGAGDLHWIGKTNLEGIEYTPLDLVPRHQSVQRFDIVTTVPPAADLTMCLWVLNHLDEAPAQRALAHLLTSGCKYLLLTWERRLWDWMDLPYMQQWILRERGDRERGHCYLRLHRIPDVQAVAA